MNILKRLVVLFFILVTSFGFSQTKITGEISTFQSEVDELLKAQKTDKASAARETFPGYWNNSGISEQHRLKIVKQSRFIRNKRWKAEPYITDIVKLTALSLKGGMSSANIDTLQQCVDALLKDNNRRNVDVFFRDALALFEDSLLYQNNNLNFELSINNIKFKYYDPNAVVEEPVEEEPIDEETEPDAVELATENFNEWDEDEDEVDDWGSTDDEWGNSEEWGDDSWGADDSWDTTEETNEVEEVKAPLVIKEEVMVLSYVAPEQPPRKGAVIEFENADLTYKTKYDTLTIQSSTGFYIPDTRTIVADGGKVDWTNAGLGDSVYVELKAYNFRTDAARILAEGATMHYESKLSKPVEGIFEFQSKKHSSKENAEYPRFMSYNSDIEITDLGENIKYFGGFSLNGSKVYSTSVGGGRCKMEVYRGDTLKFRTQSKHFILGDSVISARPASVTIYQGRDSIYHPGIRIKYQKKTEDLKIFKDRSSFKYTPFVDTYHSLNIYVDALFWNLSDTLMHMTVFNAKEETFGYFESINNFELKEYVQLKGLYYFHPLQLVVDYAARNTTKAFYTIDLAKYYKLKESTVHSAMDAMMRRGFIDYNPKSRLIVVKEKAFHFVLSRRMDKDYDVIQVRSKNPGTYNATLNLSDDTLTIKGVDRVYLSDSLDVYFTPNDRTIKVGANRSFVFDGVVETNNYIFTGRDFTFNYNDFNVNLVHIDSIQFSIEEKDSITGEVIGKKKLDNKLTYSSGTLTIDKAGNKSGKERNPFYPHFDATLGARVLFNKKEILNKAYDVGVYYQIPPFDVDSLSTNVEESVSFDGTFVSDSIFPSFKQKLIIMDDYAFGFDHPTPTDGYPLYGTEARFIGDIRLNSKGIRGKGKIVYLNSTVESGDFIFYQDSVVSLADKMYTQPGSNPSLPDSIKYPLVSVDQHLFKWMPYVDSMNVSNYIDRITVFTDTASFLGTLSVGKYGLAGNGMLTSNGAQTFSQEFLFKEHGFLSRYSQFEIVSDEPGKPALRSDRVKVDLDYTIGKATFKPEVKGESSDEFPFLQYKTTIDNGTWLIDDRIVIMESKDTSDIPESMFISTRPDQDSLKFNARKATYYIDSLYLYVEGVPFVHVADAKIIPHKEELFVRENAELDSLYNARLLIDTLSEYHNLTNGTIKIEGRQDFSGQADYAYINRNGDTLTIAFSKFELVEREVSKKETEVNTVSNGIIPESDNFHLAPYLQCKGTATMYSYKQILSIDGYVKFDLDSSYMIKPKYWLKYETQEDENKLFIPLDGQEARPEKPLIAGVYYNAGKKMFYPLFAEPLKSAQHENLFSTGGFITYKDSLGTYSIGSKEKLTEESLFGNVLSFNPDSNITYFNGKVNLLREDEEFPLNIRLDAAGTGKMNPEDTLTEVTALVSIEYELPSKLLDIMGQNFKDASRYLGTKNAVYYNDTLFQNVANLTSEKAGQKFKERSESAFTHIHEADKLLATGIVLNNVHLKYSRENRSWYSQGEIAVASVNDFNVNSVMNGYLEIKKSKSGDNVHLYLELNEMTWYYFSFKNNSLTTISGSAGYNQYVDEKSTQLKNEPRGEYFFASTSISSKNKFMKKFATKYNGGKGFDNIQYGVNDNPDGAYEEDVIEDDFEDFIDSDNAVDEINEVDNTIDTLGLNADDQETNTETVIEEDTIQVVEELQQEEEIDNSTPVNEPVQEEPKEIESEIIEDETISDDLMIDDEDSDIYEDDEEEEDMYLDELDEEVDLEEDEINSSPSKKEKKKKNKKKKEKSSKEEELIEDEIGE